MQMMVDDDAGEVNLERDEKVDDRDCTNLISISDHRM
jgi:hypothetical protein